MNQFQTLRQGWMIAPPWIIWRIERESPGDRQTFGWLPGGASRIIGFIDNNKVYMCSWFMAGNQIWNRRRRRRIRRGWNLICCERENVCNNSNAIDFGFQSSSSSGWWSLMPHAQPVCQAQYPHHDEESQSEIMHSIGGGGDACLDGVKFLTRSSLPPIKLRSIPSTTTTTAACPRKERMWLTCEPMKKKKMSNWPHKSIITIMITMMQFFGDQ